VEWEIKDPELQKLYTDGKSKKYNIDSGAAKKFAFRIQQIDAVKDIEDLHRIPSLEFKKVRNKKNGRFFTICVEKNICFLVEIKKESAGSNKSIIVITELFQ